MAKRLSRREAHRMALHYAINERDSFVDAYGSIPDDPAAVRAKWQADEMRRVLREEFGQITVEDYDIANPGPTISLTELIGRPKQDFKP